MTIYYKLEKDRKGDNFGSIRNHNDEVYNLWKMSFAMKTFLDLGVLEEGRTFHEDIGIIPVFAISSFDAILLYFVVISCIFLVCSRYHNCIFVSYHLSSIANNSPDKLDWIYNQLDQ